MFPSAMPSMPDDNFESLAQQLHPNSDGTTNLVDRADTRPLFEKHHSPDYPTSIKNKKDLQSDLAEVSMVKTLPKVDRSDQDKKFTKIE